MSEKSVGDAPKQPSAAKTGPAGSLIAPFTPGPWFVARDAAEDCPDHANSGLALVDTGRDSDWPIARLCEWNNAKAIAALPDLLDAVKSLVRVLIAERPDIHGLFGPQEWAAFRKVGAAYNRATGKKLKTQSIER